MWLGPHQAAILVVMDAFLIFCFLLQNETAKDIFDKIEKTIAEAKTVKIKYKCESTKKKGRNMSGVILLKSDKVRCSGEKEGFSGTFVSDGKKMRNLFTQDTRDAPPDLRKIIETGILRATTYDTVIAAFCLGDGDPVPNLNELKEQTQLKNLEKESGEKEGPSLSYKRDYGTGMVTIRFWYDPKTFKLTKRVASMPEGIVATEIFEEFVFDGDISDDEFKVP
jgi:outer membrane lipoprotein-sorting protein